ncbi:ABC transporter ATP-binding protein [Acidovorax sp. CCYZU-2555]|uniref:ATP-binding cassette domain-containing protein n=1 Tax=Acidovorax sp. CCYZU-2555 TaxID=2835042 RepID=UPI001BCCA0DC|nr:ABC transporter ATP-binding protein [Acidovorax sp. CCYZU-2555]MBS7778085.1 hypothetical protein [Acidovorax sp. CCYZU-2555]
MLIRDPRFVSALGLTLAQQLLLAFSTYFIARAGTALALGNIDRVLREISLFFGFALLAYATSSAASLLSARAANRIWHNYTEATLRDATQSLQYASDDNRKSIAQWLGGEALSTIVHACNFHLEMLSVGLNILFTLAVFHLALGWEIAAAITGSLVVALVLVLLLRPRIEILANAMQRRRLAALLAIEPTWNRALFGSPEMRSQGLRTLDAKMQRYFGELNRYVLLEQMIACGPIVFSTLALMGVLRFTDLFTATIAGALVALLPRSLQVFGNVHALSVSLSQFFLVRAKLRNLDGFCATLEKFDMHEVSLQAISIQGPQRQWAPAELLEALRQNKLPRGRWTVTGANGSGKSTLLKRIKEMRVDALLLGAETGFLEADNGLSTGQRRVKDIENALSMAPTLLMLDEWNANLDGENCRKIDQLLDDASRRMVVIEVRHLRPGEHPSAGRSSFDGLRTNGG